MKTTVIRVMSYNIHSGIGMDNVYDLNRIALDIRESGADVVGLQEADVHWGERSRFEDGVQTLADKLGMYSFFAPIYQHPPQAPNEPARRFGVALLSRFPLLQAINRPMTRLSTQTRGAGPEPMPGFAETVLEVEGTPVSVYVMHLDYRADPAVRVIQIREVLDVLAQSSHEKLLLGDFNARPEAEELAPLFFAMDESWPEANPGDPGFTFPADKPDRKIDYILKSSGIRTVSSRIIPSLASDHRPIIAELELTI